MTNLEERARTSDYLDFSIWIVIGWLVGLVFGLVVDNLFAFGSPLIEGVTRFVVGYGDTIGSSVAVVLHRLRRGTRSAAEPFAAGAVLGSLVGPLLHFATIKMGLSPTGLAGAVYASAYSNADNWGGVISSLISEWRRQRSLAAGLSELWHNKFVMANVLVLVLLGLLAIGTRLSGIAPGTYLASALEGTILNNDSTLASLLFFIYVRRRAARSGA